MILTARKSMNHKSQISLLMLCLCLLTFHIITARAESTTPRQQLQEKIQQISTISTDLHFALHDDTSPEVSSEELFRTLSNHRVKLNRNLLDAQLPLISSLAILSVDNGYIAWTGSFTPPPDSWFQEFANQSSPSICFYETTGHCYLLGCSQNHGLIYLSYIPVLKKSALTSLPEPTLIDWVTDSSQASINYTSPFDSLPGGMILNENHTLLSCFTITPHVETDFDSNQQIDNIFHQLCDPHFFAGVSPIRHNILHLLLFGFILWFGSGLLPVGRLHGWSRSGGVLLTILLIPCLGVVTRWLCQSLIEHSGIAWWPVLWNDINWLTIVFPLVLLAVTAGSVRVIFWSFRLWLPIRTSKDSDMRTVHLTGWMAHLIAIAVVTPMLAYTTDQIVRETVRARLDDWIDTRDNLLQFAMEANLRQMATAPELIQRLTAGTDEAAGMAWHAWKICDLNLLETRFGVEVLSVHGDVLDRFSPDFKMQRLSRPLIERLGENDASTIVNMQTAGARYVVQPLVGIQTVYFEGEIVGYVTLQIPGKPGRVQTQSGQWGEKIQVYAAQGGSDPRWPENCPVNYQPEWFDLVLDEPVWQPVVQHRFHACMLEIPDSDPRKPRILFALVPIEPLTATFAGASRLGLMSLILMLPGFIILEIKRYRMTRHRGYRGSFTQQLLGAFLIPVVVLPLAFALTLNNVIQNTVSRHLETRITHMINTTLENLHNHTIQTARLKQVAVEQQIIRYDAVIDYSPPAWLVLDSKGRAVYSSTLPIQGPLPLNLITDVFRQDRDALTSTTNVTFQPSSNMELIGQTVMPYPLSEVLVDDAKTRGTFITEIPVSGDLLQRFSDPLAAAVDIYVDGHISASNRPEMFNNDFLPMFLPGELYQRITLDQETLIHSTNTSTQTIDIFSSIQSATGDSIGVLHISTPNNFDDFTVAQPRDWLFIATALLILFGVSISVIIGRRLADPIKALTKGAQAVAGGDLTVSIPTTGVGETRMLAQSFNTMIRDLDHQRQHLEDRHAFISTLLAQLSSAIVAVDNRNRIITINPAFRDLFDTHNEELQQKDVIDFFNRLGLKEFRQAYHQWRIQSGEAVTTTKFLMKGKTIHVGIAFASVSSATAPGGTLIVIDDITDTVRSSKLQAYSDLARRIAHEVKNPLTPIQLSIEHLKQAWDDGATEFPEIFDNCLGMVLDEVSSLEKIASEFSRFARFPRPEFKTGDIRPLIEEVGMMYQSVADKIQIRVKLSDEPLICRFDRDQLKRVLINLCQNGLQAIQGEGRLNITGTGNREVVIITVEDTGRGMDSETLMHLFEPYFSTREEGTGLGLVITRAVIDAHDGVISVDSSPGVGTTFTIHLIRRFNASDKIVQD